MIQLNSFNKNDYQDLINWIPDAEMLLQFAGPKFTFPLTSQQLEASEADEKRHSFVVTDTASGESIGHAEIYLTGTSALLGRIIIGREDWRGKKSGQQIVNRLLAFSFNDLNQDVAELNVFDWNLGAIKCYEKCGFVINLDKSYTREINGKIWRAVNMILDKEKWLQLHL